MIILDEQREESRTNFLSFRTILLSFLFTFLARLPQPIDADQLTAIGDMQLCIGHSIDVDLNAVNRCLSPVVGIYQLRDTASFLLIDRLMNGEREGIKGLSLGVGDGGDCEGESDQQAEETHLAGTLGWSTATIKLQGRTCRLAASRWFKVAQEREPYPR
jgi:hypothetical protein